MQIHLGGVLASDATQVLARTDDLWEPAILEWAAGGGRVVPTPR